ncbi:MAG: hypothetical protein HDKAJFGB_02666 [Anaerolineae bacterium]|nr:hypothetical protein [Anaerolineae bacterium]
MSARAMFARGNALDAPRASRPFAPMRAARAAAPLRAHDRAAVLANPPPARPFSPTAASRTRSKYRVRLPRPTMELPPAFRREKNSHSFARRRDANIRAAAPDGARHSRCDKATRAKNDSPSFGTCRHIRARAVTHRPTSRAPRRRRAKFAPRPIALTQSSRASASRVHSPNYARIGPALPLPPFRRCAA